MLSEFGFKTPDWVTSINICAFYLYKSQNNKESFGVKNAWPMSKIEEFTCFYSFKCQMMC